jgi:hypothetical protein
MPWLDVSLSVLVGVALGLGFLAYKELGRFIDEGER